MSDDSADAMIEEANAAAAARAEVERQKREADCLRAREAECLAVIRDLRQKLAIAGVEGSPPPGSEDTTIGALMTRAHRAEADARSLRAENARLKAAMNQLEKAAASSLIAMEQTLKHENVSKGARRDLIDAADEACAALSIDTAGGGK